MTDYRRFLAAADPIVLPYFGGTRVDAADRRLRVETQLAPGWWRFQIDRRRAVPLEPASPVELGSLPVMRGHWACGWVIADGRELGRIAPVPDDEPAALSKVVARRWYSGDWIFETTDFEDEPELEARRALEARRPLGDVRGVTPSLRAAFGYALGIAAARELRIEVSMRELTSRVVAIADGGIDVVRTMFEELLAQRELELAEARRLAELAAHSRKLANAVETARVRPRARDPRRRADDILDAAGARMLECRSLDRGARLDVTWELGGTRFMTLVDAETFQVVDPGVCLAGAHRVLTLDAMPSVVREAIDEGHLNITRRS